nr:MAG TPA: hemolysin [Caudoviricetes sp.]
MNNEQDIQDIKERLVRIETLLETNNGKVELELKALEEKIKVANHRIQDLENTISWLWKTAIGGILSGALSILFNFVNK